MIKFFDMLKRFRQDDRGVFAVFFALIAIVLIATSGAVVDFTYMQTARSKAQTALDQAALTLQAQMNTQTEAQLISSAQALVVERLAEPGIETTVTGATVAISAGTLTLQANIVVPTFFLPLVGVKTITARLVSQITRSSNDLEVTIALDNTGSMAGSKISSLISATNTLIDLLVKDQQIPSYSKMAMVPYSYGVNVGSLASTVRGPVTDPAGESVFTAAYLTGSQISISGITKANPGVVTTSASHGFVSGDTIYLSGVSGMTQVNKKAYSITRISNTQFSIGVDTSSGYNTYSSSGKAQKCIYTDCDVTVTMSSAHDFANGDFIRVTGVGGLTGLNNKNFTVSAVTSTDLVLDNSGASVLGQAFTSGGTLWCTDYKCPYQYFSTKAGGTNTFAVTNCVTERTGGHAYDDTLASSGAYVGYLYPSAASKCVAQPIVPLTTNKAALKAVANGMVASGSTAGHIGLAWAWYMLSPNFNTLWPASSAAGYGTDKLIKAVILMTDGQFNTQYYNGIIAKDSDNNDGSDTYVVDTNSTNGESTTQATSLCTAIKASGGPDHNTLLFTVGFDIGTSSSTDVAARNFLRACATDSAHFYLAVNDGGASLTAAFQSIANKLSELRLSR